MKIIMSVLGGLVLLISLTLFTNYINETFFGATPSKEATLLKSNRSIRLDDNGCGTTPDNLKQYCNNVSIQRYGYLFSTAKDNKEVPENEYIAMLGHTAYQYCISGSGTNRGASCQNFSSAKDLNNSVATILFIAAEVIISLFACSWAVYYVLTKLHCSDLPKM